METREKPLILIADDDEDIRQLLVHILREDYDLLCVGDTIDALEAVKSRRPDLVLLDMTMPGGGGLEVLRAGPELRAVMLTGDDRADSIEQAFALGARGYISKPFAIDELKGVVEHALSAILPRGVELRPWRLAESAPAAGA